MSEQPKLPGVIGARPAGLVPTSFEEIWRLGNMLSETQLVPLAFRGKPNDCTAAIMIGMELGLSPMAALQSIAVVNGRPSLFGDGLMAVIRASGLMEWIKEADDGSTATCTVKRRNEPEITRAFSAADAALAGLAGKDVWKQYPARMRAMRARSWALRDTFADVLRGIASAEEMQDVQEMKDVTPASARPLAVMDELPDIPDGTESAKTYTPQTDEEFLASFRRTVARHHQEPGMLDEMRGHWREEIAERGLEQQCEDIIASVTGEAPAAEPDEALDLPWETAETVPETAATLGDQAATAAIKGLEMRFGKLHNATLIKDCWRNFESVFDQLGPDAQALAIKARDAALARVKRPPQQAAE